MKHPTFVMALTGAALATSPAAADPVRFEGPLNNAGVITGVDITRSLANQPMDAYGPSSFQLIDTYGGGLAYIDLSTSISIPGSGIVQSILQAGELIDGGLAWTQSGPNYAVYRLLFGPNDGEGDPTFTAIQPGDTGFVALSFAMDDGVHYGWIELRNSSGSGAWNYDILAWGYETEAGVGIAAGAVPAPGALALLGCVGVAARRRRR